MKPLTDFLARLLPMAPGCPEPLARQALVDAARAFCERTLTVRVHTEPQRLRAGTAQYDIDLPAETELVQVLRAWTGQRELARQALAHQDRPDDLATRGGPSYLVVRESDAVTLQPVPDGADTLTLLVATRPTRDAKTLDDALHGRWMDAVVHGALARLAVVPGQPFFNADLAGYASAQLRQEESQARLEANAGAAGGRIRVRAHPLA